MKKEDKEMGAPDTKNWKAWEDRMPPNPPGPTLHVTGKVKTNAGNIGPVLKEAVPQGFNPKILILNLTLENIAEVGTDDVAYRSLKFEKDVKPDQHTQVQIDWKNAEIELIDVEIVQ